MLYWPKLLIAAFAITNTLEAFIPLYLVNQLQLTALQSCGLIASVYLLRLFSGVWTSLVDRRPYLYGFIISLLTTMASISFIALLSFPLYADPHTSWFWALYLCALLNGIFYQPLGMLIDSAIIKTLGDYRVLFYGSYVRWSKTITLVMTGVIGLLVRITEDRYLDIILLGIYMIGMVLLLVIALLFTVVEPANASQLDISDEQAPLLLKNALSLTADQNNLVTYRPYSIFGEQLSHISEEDASQLDRTFTREDSLRPMDSYDSNAPSFYSYLSSGQEEDGDDNYLSMTLVPTIPANALALLPLPTPTDPLVAFFSWMRSDQETSEDELVGGGTYYYYYNQQQQQQNSKVNQWKTHTLSATLFILGVANALLNTFLFIYMYSILEMSIYIISCLVMVHMTCEMTVAYIMEKWFIHRLNLTLVTTCVHITLIVCAILYPSLKPDNIATHVSLIILQSLQGIAFQLIWFSGADQVNLIHSSQYERMKQRSKISALYSSIGPALGVIAAGYILQSDQNMEDYTLIFKSCVALFSLSFVVSWGWTSED